MVDNSSNKDRSYRRASNEMPERKSAKERLAEYQKKIKEEEIKKKTLENKKPSRQSQEPEAKHVKKNKTNEKNNPVRRRRAGIALVVVILLIIIIALSRCVSPKTPVRSFNINLASTSYDIDGEPHQFAALPYTCDNVVYIPAEEIILQCGYTIEYDEQKNALNLTKKKVNACMYLNSNKIVYNDEEHVFEASTMVRNEMVYMPLSMFSQFTEDTLNITGEAHTVKRPGRDLLENTYIDDSSRLAGPAINYNDVFLVGEDVGMEQLYYDGDCCRAYAEIVNNMAAALPNVQVYDMAIPSMTEFYGPAELYTDQIAGIQLIYEELSDAVMPINIVDELWAHRNEKIYFNTDHHWTHRGSYYAYKAFQETRGYDAEPLESFEVNFAEKFYGSWTEEMAGTPGADALRAHPEEFERFLPKYETTGEVYDDMYMQKLAADNWPVIKLDNNTYEALTGGDFPLTHYHSSVGNGKSIAVIQDSFGDAFSTWLINSYEDIYIVDPRNFNNFGGHTERFNMVEFYNEVAQFDDLLVVSYPGSVDSNMRQAINNLFVS